MPMRLFPVCCTVDIPHEVINPLLRAAHDEKPGTFMLVLMRDRGTKYTEPTYPPVEEGVYDSPFKGLNEVACGRLLYEIYHGVGAEVDFRWYVLVDERSIREDMVVLVGYSEREESVEMVRVPFRIANTQLGALRVGHCSLEGVRGAIRRGTWR